MNSPHPSLWAIGVLLIACSQQARQAEPAPPKVPVTNVTQQDVPVYLDAVGQTYGWLDIPIPARVDGVLGPLQFKEGSMVEKGKLLYTIDPTPFEATVREAEGQLAAAEARLVRARSNLNRIEPLVKLEALSKRLLDDAIAERDAAAALVKANEAIVENTKIELSYTRIHSPITGLIGTSNAYDGDYVGRPPNLVVLNTVSQLDPIRVRFSISERAYLMLSHRYGEMSEEERKKRQTSIELFLADGSKYPEPGTMAFASREIDPKTGTLELECTFPNPRGKDGLRPGLFARIRATLEVRKDAPMVPQKAVIEMQGTYQVYVVDSGNVVQSRIIKVGPRSGPLWMVEDGLKANERIVVSSLHLVRPGLKIEPVFAPAEPGGKGSGK